jgi:hypothetical protein
MHICNSEYIPTLVYSSESWVTLNKHLSGENSGTNEIFG